MRPFLALLAAASLAGACTSPPPASSHHLVVSTRRAGAWQGTGNMTVGDVVNTAGHFVITWDAKPVSQAAGSASSSGHFRLTVHSAVSGRPLKTVVDQAGEGHGTVDFEDDPRVYQFFVDSAGLEWWFTVDEVIGVEPPPEAR